MTTVNYETDIAAWANEQAWLVRNKKFDLLDIEHIAEEIEDVGKSEQRELASRMAVLIAHLLKWQFQAGRRGVSWERTIKEQRKSLAFHIKQVPSLKTKLANPEWQDAVWADAVILAIKETGIEDFPETCPWTFENILAHDWLPGSESA
ncbi:MAG: DUF29 domain-containing protein [Methylovulum miyakonense]|uniref:DUF29 domain-containing protein n=1 Tax=Methylovulum miyakonense TaxID=645578 RepID=UPI003BB5FE48